jgi:predicted DNA-binding protein
MLALADQERELDRQLNSGDTTSYRALIPEAKRNADELLKRYSRSGAAYDLKLANEAKSRLNALEENKNRTVAALERVRAEMATLRQKQDEVEKRAMVP